MSVSVPYALAVWRRNAAMYRRTWKWNILLNFFEPVFYLFLSASASVLTFRDGRDKLHCVPCTGTGLCRDHEWRELRGYL